MGIASDMPAEFCTSEKQGKHGNSPDAYENKDRLTHFSEEAYNKGI
ncbi:hypothetical protein CHCC20375_0305 [Bacillus licheniformis]|nr:hypothetical protein CHCC20375_0305 [Bacillus licheniformis]